MSHAVTVEPYPFKVGQKIKISETKRKGDWSVVAVDGDKLTLKWPISLQDYSWPIFCYEVIAANITSD